MNMFEKYPIGQEVISSDIKSEYFANVGEVVFHYHKGTPETSISVKFQNDLGNPKFVCYTGPELCNIRIYPTKKDSDGKRRSTDMSNGRVTKDEIFFYPIELVYGWVKDGSWNFSQFKKYIEIIKGEL